MEWDSMTMFTTVLMSCPVSYTHLDVYKRQGQILCPTFVEVGTNRPLYLHNDPDHYWVDYDYHGLITPVSYTHLTPFKEVLKMLSNVLMWIS